MSGPHRNDPCPCGSGKKYKACCLERDRATERTLRLVGGGAGRGEAPWNPAARQAEVWEADVVPLPGGFRDDPDAAPALVIVGAAGFILSGDVVPHRPVDAAGRADVVAEAVLAAGRQVGVLPPALHVRDEAVAALLAPELESRGITVSAAPIPELDEAIEGSLAHLAGDRTAAAFMTSPDSWKETEASPAELADFHAAAAAFHQAAVWEGVDDDEGLHVRFPDGPSFYAAVMGGAGVQFGLALYSQLTDVMDLFENAGDPMEVLARMQGFTLTLTLEPRARLSRRMQREVASQGWEIDGPDAYPVLIGLHIPGFRIAAGHVRTMTAALAAITVAVCGATAPEPAREIAARSGVVVEWLEDDDEEPSPFPVLEEAHAIGPEGPNARPEAALSLVWSASLAQHERLRAAERERVRRFEASLKDSGLSKAAQRRHERNARLWGEYLAEMSVPAEAATEFDLRSYVYDWFPRKEVVPADVARALPESLRLFFRFLDANEGIRYPWAEGVLDELAVVAAERGPAPEGAFWDEEVREWRTEFWEDVDHRVMLHDRDLPGTGEGWPVMMNPEVARLSTELQRLWLIWYDQAVRGGTTDLEELFETLSLRQRGWENTPHPALHGRTPRQAVIELEREHAENPPPSIEDFAGRGEDELEEV